MKKLNAIVFSLVLALIISACSGSSIGSVASASENYVPTFVVISSGSSGGTFYYLGAGQASILGERMPGFFFTTEATSGTFENNHNVNQDPARSDFQP